MTLFRAESEPSYQHGQSFAGGMALYPFQLANNRLASETPI